MLGLLNYIAYCAIYLVAYGLLIACCRSLSIRTTTMWAQKYGLSLRVAVTKVKASFSIGRNLSSAPQSARLVQYIGFCTLSSSLTKASLTATRETTRQRNSSSPGWEGLSNGGEEGYAFRSSKACWHLAVHSKDFFNVQKKGRHLSVALETNLFSIVILPLRHFTSFVFLGGAISIMAQILFGLTSIPL